MLHRCSCIAIVLLATGSAWAAPIGDAPSQAPIAIPGGVADPDGKTGYIVNAKGELDAVNLEDGKVLWSVKEKLVPLVAHGNKLVAVGMAKEPNTARVRFFDNAQKGKQILESDPIKFPDWVTISQSGLGYTFSGRAALDQGALVYGWEARSFYFGGVPLPPEELKKREKQAKGIARVNLDKGKVEELDAEKFQWPTVTKPPKELAKVEGLPFTVTDQFMTPLQADGDKITRIAWGDSKDGKERNIYLLSWEAKTGKALEPKLILKGGPFQYPTVTLDGKHLWIQMTDEKFQPTGRMIYDLATGKELGKLPKAEPGTEGHEIAVVGGKLLYIVNKQEAKGGTFTTHRTLTARPLKGDKDLWGIALQPIIMLPPPP